MLSMSPSKRRDTDMMKLMMSDFDVHIPDESSMHDFLVAFPGPEDTPYQGGTWKVHVTLPKEYPFRSPSIGFENRMFHPNVDEMSGSVCLDVINQTWSPMFDLVNIFKLFIPQLLSYPNPTDPLNGEAAALLLRDPEAYATRIRECVRLHASDPVNLDGTPVVPTDAGESSTASGTNAVSPADNVSSSSTAIAIISTSNNGNSVGGSSSDGNSTGAGSRSSSDARGGSSGSDSSAHPSDEKEAGVPTTNTTDANANGNNAGTDVKKADDAMDTDDKRRDSAEGGNNPSSSRSSSSSDFMMEMEMDETASDVSLLSDVDA